MLPDLPVSGAWTNGIPLHTWGLMITMAFLVASAIAHGRASKVGLDPDKMTGFYIIAVIGGLLGARLLHFLMATPEVFFKDPWVFFRLWEGGFAFYGGFIALIVIAPIYTVARGMNFWKLADVCAPLTMLGLGIGRLGCFSAGCCHGRTVELPADAIPLFPASFEAAHGQLYLLLHPPFLIALTHHGVGLNNVPVLSTQLYESFAVFCLFLFTSWLWRHRRFDGEVFAAVLVLYAIWRPINESLRGDEVRGMGYFGFLTTSQLVSIPVGLFGIAIVLWRFRKGVAPEAPFRHEEPLEGGSRPRL